MYHAIGLTLNIDETDNALYFELARSVAAQFRLKDARVVEIIERTVKVMEDWRQLASALKIQRGE